MLRKPYELSGYYLILAYNLYNPHFKKYLKGRANLKNNLYTKKILNLNPKK